MKYMLKVYGCVIVVALVLVFWPEGQASAANCLKVVNNLTITNTTGSILNVKLCNGNYRIADNDANGVIIIKGSNINLDASGVKLTGAGSSGYGIYLNGTSAGTGSQINNVSIKNFSQISGYRYGMRLENATNLLIQKNVISGNRKTDNYWLNINNGDPNTTEGGGVLLNNVSNSTIGESLDVSKPTSAPQDWAVSSTTTGLYNSFQNENSGIEILNGTQNNVAGNIVSGNKAWGVRLYNSIGNVVYNNQANNVYRCNPKGCDSAGILLVQGSNGNRVEGNNLQNSGDGFFIGNQNSTPSNYNYIVKNDGSFSPNNAFEATFGTGNIFDYNKANSSHYGFWLGYSTNVQLTGNTISSNLADGVNIDRGNNLTMQGNTVTGNTGSGVAMTYGNCGGSVVGCPNSTGHAITGNTINDNTGYGLYVSDTTFISVNNGNLVSGNGTGFYFTGASSVTNISGNNIECASSLKTCTYNASNNMSNGNNVDAGNNWWGSTDTATIAAKILDGNDDSTKGLINFDPIASVAF